MADNDDKGGHTTFFARPQARPAPRREAEEKTVKPATGPQAAETHPSRAGHPGGAPGDRPVGRAWQGAPQNPQPPSALQPIHDPGQQAYVPPPVYRPPKRRTRSFRTAAVLGGLFFATGGAGVLAIVVILLIALMPKDQGDQLTAEQMAMLLQDTGSLDADLSPELRDKVKEQRKQARAAREAAAQKAKVQEVEAAKAVVVDNSPKPISVVLRGQAEAPFLRLQCPGGYNKRVTVRGMRASFDDVPLKQKCKISIDSGTVANFTEAYAGHSYTCDVQPPRLVCRG